MRTDREQPELNGHRARSYAPGFLGKVLAGAVGVVLLLTALAFSLVLFAVALTGGLVLWGYLWWKTRTLRKQMRERPLGGHVIEGEVIRDQGTDDVVNQRTRGTER